MSIIIGLTGPTGSGKSSVYTACEKYGIKVINCDLLARKAVEKGSAGLRAVTESFGSDILQADGSLNRKALAAKAFSTAENTEKLNCTLLPFIVEKVFENANGERVLLDAPTLFESGIDSACFKTVAVLAKDSIRLTRIMQRDNISESEARLRMNAGKNDNFYKEKADYIIYNNGDRADFLNEFSRILEEILQNGEDL